MGQVKTVKVRFIDDDRHAKCGHIIINETDFDPGLHQKARVELSPEVKEKQAAAAAKRKAASDKRKTAKADKDAKKGT